MNERDLGKELLSWDAREAANGADTRQLVANILRRDRTRVRWLAGWTIVLWILSTAGTVVMLIMVGEIIAHRGEFVLQQMILRPENMDAQAVYVTSRNALFGAIKGIVAHIGISMVLFFMAACCTVFLIFATRRATLRQVNANLAVIAEQLKLLQPPKN